MSTLVFTVEGRPVSWARTNIVKGRPTTDAKQRSAKKTYALAARAALGRKPWERTGTFAVYVDAFYPDRNYGDIDRIPGLVLDALEGVLYDRDRQVSSLVVLRYVDRKHPRIVVQVKAEGEDAEVVP